MVREACSVVQDSGVGWDFVHNSAEMARIEDISRRIADKDVPVLLLGESGVGKEVVARFIHMISERRAHRFLKINCAAVPRDLLESELFGYERGAFTGATQTKTGLLEMAGEGTIVLDEIGEMDRNLQAKLLHVLQDREYCRVGGTETVAVRARILATTNRPLERAVAAQQFREDLYFRLAVIRIDIPPLRERRDDIRPLTEHFLRKYSQRFDTGADGLPPELADRLLEYHWPGNVRQLENVIQRYLLLSDIEPAIEGSADVGVQKFRDEDLSAGTSLLDIGARAAERAQKEAVLRALEETGWNRKAAARRLRVSYKTLLNKLQKWQVNGREELRNSLR
jgi:transcriptional regulator with PAS, ATPase and Fis domain